MVNNIYNNDHVRTLGLLFFLIFFASYVLPCSFRISLKWYYIMVFLQHYLISSKTPNPNEEKAIVGSLLYITIHETSYK